MHLKSLSRVIQLLLLTAVAMASHEKILRKISKQTRRHLADNQPTTSQTKNANAPVSNDPKGDLKCNQRVPQMFNMTGTGNLTSQVFLDVCGLSNQSCCTLKDQEKMVEIWNNQGVGFNLKDRMEFHKKLVRDVYDEAINVAKRARQILEPKKTPSPECLFMARRVAALRINEIFPRITNNYARMHEFLFTAYKGLQCAACDPATNSQFDVDKKEIILSPKFCRDLISNSLNAALYNHKHTPVIARLLITFLDTCDAEGAFKQAQTPQKSPLTPNSSYETELDKCKKSRNTPFWLENCMSFCQQFKVGQFDAFFEPEIKSYSRLARSLKQMVTAFDAKTVINAAPVQPTQINAQQNPSIQSNAVNTQNTATSPANPQPAQQTGATQNQQIRPASRKLRRRPRILNVQTNTNSPAVTTSQIQPNSQTPTSNQAQGNPKASANGQESFDESTLERYLKPSIFPSEGTNPHPIEQFVTKIKVKGIDLYKYGNFAELTTSTVQSAQSVQKVDQGVKNRSKARKLKSATIWRTIGSIIAIFLILA